MTLLQGQLRFAARLVQAGHLAEAREALDDILGDEPNFLDAMLLQARVLAVMGEPGACREMFERAMTLAPARADLYFDFGNMLGMAEDYEAALPLLAKAVALDPANGRYSHQLGCTWSCLGNTEEARRHLQDAVEKDPTLADAWQILGHMALAEGDSAAASAAFERLLALNPDSEEGGIGMSIALRMGAQNEEADAFLAAAMAKAPDSDATRKLAELAQKDSLAGMMDDALWSAHEADPLAVAPLCALGYNLKRYGRLPDLLPQLIAASLENGDNADLMALTGQALLDSKNFGAETESVLLHAATIDPTSASACNGLGHLHAVQGNLDEAIRWFRQAHEHNPADIACHSNLLFALRHVGGMKRTDLFAEHKRFGEIQEALVDPLPLPPLTAADAHRKIRIGFVSPDLRAHPVFLLFSPYLDGLDRNTFEITLYYTHYTVDAVTLALQTQVDHWRHIVGMHPDQAARLVQDDGIDILVDLAGHTAHSGLPIFLRKPAPVQITWLGYPGTSGTTRIDYRITSQKEAKFSTEKVISGLSTALRPPSGAPEVLPPPVMRTGHVTFCCTNRPIKVTPRAVEAWSRILDGVAGSRLVLFASAEEIGATAPRLKAAFAEQGIDTARVDVEARMPLTTFMSYLNANIDITLDPFPYGGGTTSLLTAWMGIPMIVRAGPRETTRLSRNLLLRAGLDDLVTTSFDGYVQAAVGLAHDTERLTTIRKTFRPALQHSLVAEEAEKVTKFQQELRRVWQETVAAAAAQMEHATPG